MRSYADSIAIPRAKRMNYSTLEFQYTADINSLGFRDREWPSKKDADQIRIAVLGDSFTFGWGVDEEASWPRVLEKILRGMGYPVVVMNLAKPGYFPYMYAAEAQQHFPHIKPDIALVTILLGDDLVQMEKGDCCDLTRSSPHQTSPSADRAMPAKHKPHPTVITYLKRALQTLYPNIIRVRAYRAKTQSTPLSATWKLMCEAAIHQFSPEEYKRFLQLDENLKTMALNGELNPSLFVWGIAYPRLHADVWNLDSDRTRRLVNRMAQCLRTIQQTGAACGVRAVAAVSLPHGMYACKKKYSEWAQLGLSLFPSMLTDDNADEAVRRACRIADIPFISVTESIRIRAEKAELYFTYDDHFNARGHTAYAELIAPKIIDLINQNIVFDSHNMRQRVEAP